jgi:hypothetical protein
MMKEDVLEEAVTWGGRILLHKEVDEQTSVSCAHVTRVSVVSCVSQHAEVYLHPPLPCGR